MAIALAAATLAGAIGWTAGRRRGAPTREAAR